jgi:predicted transcriptional regulator
MASTVSIFHTLSIGRNFAVLSFLSHHGSVTVHNVAERVGMPRRQAQASLDRLVLAGLACSDGGTYRVSRSKLAEFSREVEALTLLSTPQIQVALAGGHPPQFGHDVVRRGDFRPAPHDLIDV